MENADPHTSQLSTKINGTAHPEPPSQSSYQTNDYMPSRTNANITLPTPRAYFYYCEIGKCTLKQFKTFSSDCLKETETPHYRHFEFKPSVNTNSKLRAITQCTMEQLVWTLTVQLNRKIKRALAFQMGILKKKTAENKIL